VIPAWEAAGDSAMMGGRTEIRASSFMSLASTRWRITTTDTGP
jgi:hypothetical protein